MPAIAYYLLKVLACSGLLYAYYLVALRNRRFHQYNRFYLLFAVIASWMIPLVQFEFLQPDDQSAGMVQMLSVVANTNAYVEQQVAGVGESTWNWYLFGATIFLMISACFFSRIIYATLKLYKIVKKSPQAAWENIQLVFCREKEAPFSYFNYIFWHADIELDSPEGSKILVHELTHIREKHGLDVLFMNVVLVAGWFNPVFWLMNKELRMIHEFIADKKAIADGDTAAFSAMLLKATFPTQTFLLTNSFFYSPIKRRLLMLTSSKHSRHTYLRRLSILPIFAVIVMLFAFKIRQADQGTNITIKKKYTVVLDPGHGGSDKGAIGSNAVEKDVVLKLSRYVKENIHNNNIDIILTREGDETLTPQERSNMLKRVGADLLVSLHLNALGDGSAGKSNQESGAKIFLSQNSNNFTADSRLLGSILSKNFEQVYTPKTKLMQAKQTIYLLDKQDVCPAVLVECGYITNQADMNIMQNETYRFAGLIASGIEAYFSAKEGNSSWKEAEVNGYGNRESVNITKRASNTSDSIRVIRISPKPVVINMRSSSLDTSSVNKPLYVIDGVVMNEQQAALNQLDASSIQSINVLKGASAEELYGTKGRNGVIQITTKSKAGSGAVESIMIKPVEPEKRFDKIFTKVENPPYYEAGMMAFADYVTRNMHYPKEAIANDVEGAVIIQFIVDENGDLSNFKKQSAKGYGMEEEAIRLLKNSGKWQPGIQHGRKVPVQVSQQITFKLPGKGV